MEVDKHRSYLEETLDATITYEANNITFAFQRAKVKTVDELEIHLLKTINPELNKSFHLTEDQVIIKYHPPHSYAYFTDIYKKGMKARWQLAYNIVQVIKNHHLNRAKLCVSPDNIVYDQGLVPSFLHYGVSESLPPYETNKQQLLLETKAMIAVIADNTYDFYTYLAHYETKELPEIPKAIMQANSIEDLITIIEDQIKMDDKYEETVIHIPKKTWQIRHYMMIGLAILLIPALIYSSFALFFKIPETEAYVNGTRYFHEEKYSSVIETLSKYDHNKMPRITQYELALSYVVSETLTEEQRKNVKQTLTLKSDRKYFLYWIDVGRGNFQEAFDTARVLEDRDLIVFSLLKLRESVKADSNLSAEERESELKQIQQDIDEYEKEMQDEQDAA